MRVLVFVVFLIPMCAAVIDSTCTNQELKTDGDLWSEAINLAADAIVDSVDKAAEPDKEKAYKTAEQDLMVALQHFYNELRQASLQSCPDFPNVTTNGSLDWVQVLSLSELPDCPPDLTSQCEVLAQELEQIRLNLNAYITQPTTAVPTTTQSTTVEATTTQSTTVETTTAELVMSVVHAEMNSAEVQKRILDKHNELRHLAVTDAEGKTYTAVVGNLVGRCTGSFSGTWDAGIASRALNHAKTLRDTGDNMFGCSYANSNPTDRAGNGETIYGYPEFRANTPFIDAPFSYDPAYVVAIWWMNQEFFYYRNGTYEADQNCEIGRDCQGFAQGMWASTTKVGCGTAVCPQKCDFYYDFPSKAYLCRENEEGTMDYYHSYIMVCQYAPGGNIVGEKMFDRVLLNS